MKIAYIGNFEPKYSTENDIRLTLEAMGHSVLRVQESTVDWPHLPDLVAGVDQVWWTRTAGFDPPDKNLQRAALAAVDAPTVGVHLDRWWGLHREQHEGGPLSDDPTPFFWCDFLFTADGGHQDQWDSIGANHYWMPPAVARRNAVVGNHRRHLWGEVGFVGNLRRYGHAEWSGHRQELYRRLANRYRKFRLWEGGQRGSALADIYASVDVMVGDSCLAGGATHYWSDRIPETLGRAGFLIHPDVEGLRDHFPEGTLVTYQLGDWDDLFDQVDRYLADPGERTALRDVGRSWVLANHLYDHRIKQIFDTVSNGR